VSQAARLDELQTRHGISGAVRFEGRKNGLVCAIITTPQAEALVYLHGAHVAHYQPRGERPVLFMSERSRFEPGAAIRGGVPIVFPWFGPKAGEPSAPMHGFARFTEWRLEAATQAADGSVTLVLALEADAATQSRWPHAFSLLRYGVTIGSALGLTVEVSNRSDAALTFEEALHTYLAVSDVRQISVTGLAGARYIDNTDRMKRKMQEYALIHITGETDRVYLGTKATCAVDDPIVGRRLVVEKSGSDATVVWNPWSAKAKAMPDFGDDEWPGMLCIESGNVADHAVTLGPGQRHEMRVSIRSEPRSG
jgi:glucose-6-phosphate 1-epimerase